MELLIRCAGDLAALRAMELRYLSEGMPIAQAKCHDAKDKGGSLY